MRGTTRKLSMRDWFTGKTKAIRGSERGITTLETAIILIAFVLVSSVFAYTVLTAGIFSSEKGKEAVNASIEEVRSSMVVKGNVVAYKGAVDIDQSTATTDTTDAVVKLDLQAQRVDDVAGRDVAGGADDLAVGFHRARLRRRQAAQLLHGLCIRLGFQLLGLNEGAVEVKENRLDHGRLRDAYVRADLASRSASTATRSAVMPNCS